MANARASEAVKVAPIELQTAGFLQSFSIDKAKPGRVVVKMELYRIGGLLERLAALADGQLAIEVILRQMQVEMPLAPSSDGEGPPEDFG
jgi:hypothetical protein